MFQKLPGRTLVIRIGKDCHSSSNNNRHSCMQWILLRAIINVGSTSSEPNAHGINYFSK